MGRCGSMAQPLSKNLASHHGTLTPAQCSATFQPAAPVTERSGQKRCRINFKHFSNQRDCKINFNRGKELRRGRGSIVMKWIMILSFKMVSLSFCLQWGKYLSPHFSCVWASASENCSYFLLFSIFRHCKHAQEEYKCALNIRLFAQYALKIV